jgi:DNA helicase II / ATP-dependent DNA helicase PcrA
MHLNICVVGDDAQSIYAFRGANIQNILNFEKDYPELKMFKLEQNYRSTKTIVQAANSVIKYNKAQLKKIVWTDNSDGELIKLIRAATDNEEGQIVANKIFDQRMSFHLAHQDIAILYRTNAQSRAMEEALRKRGVPYRIYGGLSFYKRKEIKDLIAYFRLAINYNDEEALKRIINYPARGIGKTSLEKVAIAANQNGVGLWEIISNLHQYHTIGGATAGKIQDFVTMIKSFRHGLETIDAYQLGMHIAKSSGLLKELGVDKTPEGISKHENVMALLNGIQEFVDTPPESEEEVAERTLDVFMRDIALLTDADENDNEVPDKVSLMTVHAAKGLEFKSVFVVGMEDNLFPSQLSLTSKEELEEERRLFYVAITRAEKHLTLTYASSRYRWGQVTHGEASQFLEEIEPSLLDRSEDSEPRGFLDFSNDRNSFGGFDPKPKTIEFKVKEKPNTPAYQSKAKPQFNKITAGKPHIEPFEYDDNSKLESGMEVVHERFGKGQVLAVEGRIGERKATVFFETVGQKQLLLKFARLKIIS